MSRAAVVVGEPTGVEQEMRCAGIARAFHRLAALGTTHRSEPAADTSAAIRTLAATGRLSLHGNGPWTLHYAAGGTVLAAIADRTAPSWGERVDSKQRQALRRTPGAIFHLPLASGTGNVDVFITDWSPFPAACAIAVHPDHPAATTTATPPAFAGQYVRHPLHGDLLPIWTADWVRPEFGSGAVVVNPAHSQVDLEFARTTGLPIRFGLAETPPTANPATWPEPPVVKTGRAVRTGQFDDLPYDEAAQHYLRTLIDAGHATETTLTTFGLLPVATLTLHGDDLTWTPSRRIVGLMQNQDPDPDSIRVGLTTTPLFAAATAVAAGSEWPVVICPNDAVPIDLLWARALVTELAGDNSGRTALPIGRVGPVKGIEERTLADALVVAGRADEMVTIKPQQAEQVTRMHEDHSSIMNMLTTDQDAIVAATKNLADALRSGDLASAFAKAYRIARSARRGTPISTVESATYMVTAHVLLGLSINSGATS